MSDTANFDAMSLAFRYGYGQDSNGGAKTMSAESNSSSEFWIDPGLVDYKTAVYRTKHRDLFLALQEKKARGHVPLVGSSTFGSGSQGRLVGAAIPDLLQDEGWRVNPIMQARGGVRERLQHPLRGGLGPQIGPDVVGALLYRRCPAGYEHGGRFTNRAFGNCGALLFDIFDGPGGASVIGNLMRSVRNGTNNRNIGRLIGEGRYLNEPTIVRKPHIPDLATPNKNRQTEIVQSLVRRLGDGAGKEESVFVRADGVSMLPKASVAKIARSRANKDIVDGVMIVRAPKVDQIGGEEVSLLGSGARSVVYALPGNRGQVTLTRSGDFTTAQAGAMRRRLGALSRRSDMTGPERLRSLADNTSNLTYSEIFDGIENPSQLVRVGLNGKKQTSKLVPRWLYEVYLAEAAPGRNGAASWSIIESNPA